MPAIEDVRRPRLWARFLIAIDESAFRSSTPIDQARLAKAASAFRSTHYGEVLDKPERTEVWETKLKTLINNLRK